jgi:hypothetical protein
MQKIAEIREDHPEIENLNQLRLSITVYKSLIRLVRQSF